MPLTNEKKKQIAAIALACIALSAITYNLFFADSSSSSTPTATKPKTANKGVFTPVSPQDAPSTAQAKVQMVSQPLNLSDLGSAAAPMIARNIFIYPPPPPPRPSPTIKPTPPPPPPPITLGGVNPGSVIARTADFPLTVFGAKIPDDAQVYVNGAPYPTTVTGDSQAKITVPSAVIANPGAVQIEVKSASDPARLYSNRVSLGISAPPVPQYKYLGLIVKSGVSMAYIKDESDTQWKNVKKGDKFGRWQITNITPSEIEITDTSIQIKHRIPFTGEGS